MGAVPILRMIWILKRLPPEVEEPETEEDEENTANAYQSLVHGVADQSPAPAHGKRNSTVPYKIGKDMSYEKEEDPWGTEFQGWHQVTHADCGPPECPVGVWEAGQDAIKDGASGRCCRVFSEIEFQFSGTANHADAKPKEDQSAGQTDQTDHMRLA